MPSNLTLLVEYQYDALNRLVGSTPSAQAVVQRFYLENHLVTEIHGAQTRSIMQHDDQLLAQQQRKGKTAVQTALLATGQSRSVMGLLDTTETHVFTYPPYGYSPPGNGLLSLLGFNGERLDSVTGWYFLGNGYRAFNPVLMRFTSPDSWSPFGEGGLNAYTYCVGNPVNRGDPTGHLPAVLKPLLRTLGIIKKTLKPTYQAATKADIQTLVPPRTLRTTDAIYELVGFHGTSAADAQKIPQTGLDPTFIKPGGFFGEGFYTTPHKSKALSYTKPVPGTSFAHDPNGMLAVYVKEPANKIQDQHFTFHPGVGGALDELLLLPDIYSHVKTLQFRPTLATQTPNIRETFNIQSEIRST